MASSRAVKPPEPSPEPQRLPPPRLPFSEPGPARSDETPDKEFQPRYLELPEKPVRGHGGRNLAWGVLLIVAAAVLLGQAVYLAGPRAAFSLFVSLLTLAALYVLARARMFRQRNGGFVALGVVCLLGTLLPLAEFAWTSAAQRAGKNEMAGTAKPGAASAAPKPAAGATEALVDAFKIAPPDSTTPGFKVLHDLRVEIDGKSYLIRTGDTFPIAGSGEGEVRFNAGNQQVALPTTMIEMLNAPAPSAASQSSTAARGGPAGRSSPQESAVVDRKMSPTEQAQREAIRRYPALGVKGSAENKLFIETYQELKHGGGEDFFTDPEWPLTLAELLARREGWGDHYNPVPETPPSQRAGGESQRSREQPPESAATEEGSPGESIAPPDPDALPQR